jgi:triosephosphate isomerase
MEQQKKILVGNWKMNPVTESEVKNIITEIKKGSGQLKKTDLVICPPFVFMSEVEGQIKNNKNIFLGAQNSHYEDAGAHTGEVSPDMLKSIGCDYVIIGHSERRLSGETDEIVSKKINLVTKKGLTAIVCIGEKTRDEHGEFWHQLKEQILGSLNKVNRTNLKKVIIAYEPVFAIGKSEGEALTPALLKEVVIFIRKTLSDLYGRASADKVTIIYGGSVGTKNAESLIVEGGVDGLLLGRESLKPLDFSKIANILEGLK